MTQRSHRARDPKRAVTEERHRALRELLRLVARAVVQDLRQEQTTSRPEQRRRGR